jgi:hypothetical protein
MGTRGVCPTLSTLCSYTGAPGKDPVVGQAGLEPPYRWKFNRTHLNLPYKFEEQEYENERL